MKKLLVMLMCVAMVLSMMPAVAFGATETEAASTAVAKIGDVEYATLNEAFANVQDSDYIILQQDVTVAEKIAVNANYVGLDLNGYKLTATTEDKVAFEVKDKHYLFRVYDGVYTTSEYGKYGGNFDAKIYVDNFSSASVANCLYDGTQVIYENDNYELVLNSDWIYMEYKDTGEDEFADVGVDAVRFNVCTEDIVIYYFATRKLDGIYFSGDYLCESLGDSLGLAGEVETIGHYIDLLPLEPDGESVKLNSWGGYCVAVGSTLQDTLDLEYNYVTENYPEEIQYYFHESMYPGYRIAGWKEVVQYDVDYDTEKVIDLVLGDEIKEFNGSYITVCPIWEKVETPTVDPNTEVEKVVVVVDEKAQEKAVKAVNKLIEDIAAGKDTDKKVSVNIKHIINKALADGVETFDVYTEAKVETLEKGDVATADVTLVEEQVGEGTVAQYLDLSVQISVMATGNTDSYQATGNLYQLDEAMTFNIAIPKELKDVPEGMQREYYVVRVHDGKAEVLDVTVNGDGTLSFVTDRFSTYALAYKDTPNAVQVPSTTAPAVPNTGDADTMLTWLAVIALMGAGAAYFKRREN